MSNGFESKFVEIDGVSINYTEGLDNGPDLVFLHGFPGQWTEHLSLYERLADAFHVFAPTMRGMGESSRADFYSMSLWIDDVGRFIRAVCEPPVFGVGHSAGAWFGLAAAAMDPGLFRSFVSLDQPLNPSDHVRFHEGRRHSVVAMVTAMREAKGLEDLASSLARVPASSGGVWADVLTAEEIAAEARDLSKHDPEIFAPWVDDSLEAFILVPELQHWPGSFRGPVLFLDGDPAAGSMVDADAAAYNLDRYPWAERLQLSGLSHNLDLWEGSSQVAAKVRQFFEGN